MREQLNNNPVAQIGMVAVLLLVGGFMLLSSMGGGGGSESESSEEAAPATSTSATAAPEEAVTGEAVVGTMAQPGTAVQTPPRLPEKVLTAWRQGQTPVLLFVHDGGADDRAVRETTEAVAGFDGTHLFVVPAKQLADYTAITEGVGLNRVPALVVVTPKRLSQQGPTASIHYGFQSHQSVAQAIIDAGYEGPTLDYHP